MADGVSENVDARERENREDWREEKLSDGSRQKGGLELRRERSELEVKWKTY